MAQVWIGPWFGVYSRLHVPFAQLAQELRAMGFTQGTIVTDSVFLGGNLPLAFTASRVLTLALPVGGQLQPHHTEQCLIAWESRDRDPLPKHVRRCAEKTLLIWFREAPAPRYLEVPLGPAGRQTFQLGVLLSTAGLGDCH
jgi:hypothetical protein